MRSHFMSCFLLLVALSSCSKGPAAGDDGATDPIEVTIYAAASLRDVMRDVCDEYSRNQPIRFVVNFGSSGDLARQIVAAGAADLFFSADTREMDRVASAGLVIGETRRDLLANSLVVVTSLDGVRGRSEVSGDTFVPEQLALDGVQKLSLAHVEAVPAGRYAKMWLERRGLWTKIESRVIQAVDVRAALGVVETGAAEFGIVYATDAAQSKKVRVIFRVPPDEGPRITYPVAVIKGARSFDAARQFAEFLASEPAAVIFRRFGFSPLSQ